LLAAPGGSRQVLEEVRARASHVLTVAGNYRRRLAVCAADVRNGASLSFLISAAHKMQNHAARTLYMLDQQQAIRQAKTARTEAERTSSIRAIAALAGRLESLLRDTKVTVDEVDRLTVGPPDQISWQGQVAQGRAVTWPTDATGYHRVLASLLSFKAQLAEERESLESAATRPELK